MITATVLTKNSEKSLEKTLISLKNFPEVIVLDSGSEDNTLLIAKNFLNVQIHRSEFLGFGPMHNLAAKLASHDWILSIDSDEILSDELSHEILSADLNPQTIYQMRRINYFNDKQMKCCAGWDPDWVIRLYYKKTTQFSEDLVHEKVQNNGLLVHSFEHSLLHTPYEKVDDFLNKMQHYSSLFADQNQEKNASVPKALVHGWAAFFKSYVLKKGFLGGKEGLIISLYNGHTAYYKYLKLAEKKDKDSTRN